MACGSLIVEIAGNRDLTGVGIDGESPTGIVIEAVSDRIAIGIRGQGSYADAVANSGVFH